MDGNNVSQAPKRYQLNRNTFILRVNPLNRSNYQKSNNL